MTREAPPPLPAEPLPEGSRILHIGPSKTGTTALQGACWAARADLERQGVFYAGNRRHAAAPARAVTGLPAFAGSDRTPPPMFWWTQLVRDVRRSQARHVMYSSEFLAHADDAGARRIVEDIDPGVHVTLTLRPLEAILASKWQQAVQAGSTQTLEAWLTSQFAIRNGDATAGVWRMHDHGRLVRRWATAAGAPRVTVVIVDPRDHDFLFRAFEGLLGLRAGTLQQVDDLQNRSLTLPEVEVIRQFNLQAADAGMSRGARNSLVLAGAALATKGRPPAADAPRVRLPAWAVDRARELAAAAVAEIRDSGVRVVGDLDSLTPTTAVEDSDAPAVDLRVDAATAAAAALGVAYGTGLRFGPGQPEADLPPLPFLRSKDLLRIRGDRLRRRLLRVAPSWDRLASLDD